MGLAPRTVTFGDTDHTWLGSSDGISSARTVSMKVSAFVSGTHYPNGFLPDGIALAIPTSGSNSGLGVPLAARANEVQVVTITGTPTGGTVTLTFDGETTAAIAYNATSATVQSALEALSNVNTGDVIVTGGPGPGTAWTVTFSGSRYRGSDVPQMTATSSLTGGTSPAIAVTTSTGGGSGTTDGSDLLAGFLLFPKPVLTTDTVIHGALLDFGRVINANLPFPLTLQQKATNSQFRWL